MKDIKKHWVENLRKDRVLELAKIGKLEYLRKHAYRTGRVS